MTLHVYENKARDWFVAESAEEAYQMGLVYGAGLEEYEAETYTKCPDDKVLKIHDEDTGTRASRTCTEWARERGKGFLCTENF